MKTKYIIATASGWYWRAYNISLDEFNFQYTKFDSEEDCMFHIEKALQCRNAGGDITIMKIYTT